MSILMSVRQISNITSINVILLPMEIYASIMRVATFVKTVNLVSKSTSKLVIVLISMNARKEAFYMQSIVNKVSVSILMEVTHVSVILIMD